MLGTFSFEPYIKSYHWFTFRSLEFSDIANRPPFSFLPAPLLPAPLNRAARRLPGQLRLRLCFALAPTRRPGAAPPPSFLALEPPRPCHAPTQLPEPPRRPPPRRRRGATAAAPQGLLSRAPQPLENPYTLFRTLSLRFPAPTPQNTAAAPQNAGELTLAVEPTPPPFLALN